MENILGKLRAEMPFLSRQYGVNQLSVFGSYVREQANLDSDLDLLVSFDEPPGLIEFLQLEHYLSDLLEIRVDLVMKDALKPEIGKRILGEAVRV